MAPKRNDDVPVLRVRKGATLKEIYAARRRALTAEELQRYTQDDEMISAQEVLTDLRAIHEQELAKMRQKPTTRRKR